jgi:agmatine deiminase
MRLSLFLLATLAITAVSSPLEQPDDFRLPAEFEPQQAVWMSARPTETGKPVLDVVIEMVRALSPHVRIQLMVPTESLKAEVQERLRQQKVDQGQISYWTTSVPTRWYRDIGAIFLRNSAGALRAVDFNFNCYGECPTGSEEAQQKKEGLDREIAVLAAIPTIRTALVSEGGDREVNGKGTLMAIEETEMQRNQGMSRNQIEKELLHLLGQKKMIWLKRGIAEDDDPMHGPLYANVYAIGCGHIDEMARFVAADTIALAEVTEQERRKDPVMGMTYDRLEENYRILQAATDQDGHKFKIVRMPVADPIYQDFKIRSGAGGGLDYFHGTKPGQEIRIIISASYMNFFISNGVVLEAAYWQPGRPESTRRKDQASAAMLKRLFPSREIVQIHAENLNYGGGGMHCATQQQPEIARVRHGRPGPQP